MLVDSHCHLDLPEFDGELDIIVKRAQESNVKTILTICTQIARFKNICKIAERYKNVYCTVGTHPNDTKSENQISASELISLSKHSKVVGFGETGLDYFYQNSPKNIQKRQFRAHIRAAREANLPLIIHSRNADEDTAEILESEYKDGAFSGVIHCFTGGKDLARRVLDLGFYISLTGIITYKNATDIRDVIKSEVPMERLLVETDAPYLAPVPKRGKRNEPAFTQFTAKYLADLLSVSEDEFARTTTNNFFRLFTKSRRPYSIEGS